MQDNRESEHGDPVTTGLEQRIRALDQPPVPDDLVARCLATIPGEEPTSARRIRRFSSWKRRTAVAAAAALFLLGTVALLVRPRDAAAAHFLQTVRSTWTEVPACHRVIVMKGPELARTIETWFVRGKGGRQEVRSSDHLIGVVVNNGRWEFHWDVPARLVAAWSTSLMGKRSVFEGAGLVHDSEALLRWAEQHRAEIREESALLDGRKARKATLRWPGPGSVEGHPQVDTVWFDPETLHPLRQLSELWDGQVTDSRIDYPSPNDVPEDLLAFRPPRDVTLEINDPDLGRQVYSDARQSADNTDPQTKGTRP
jgi:hypothetical protein